jgi:anti-sigma factor RsiW
MSCERVTGAIVALLDGELAERERRDVESHLASCTACALELRRLEATRRIVSAHLAAAAGRIARPCFDDLWERVAADPASGAARPVRDAATSRPGPVRDASTSRPGMVSRPQRGGRRWLWAGASAGLALAAGLALVVLAPRLSDPTSARRDARAGKAPTVATAPQVVAAKPARSGATRVAKSAPDDDDRAQHQVARRAEPKSAPEPTSPVPESPASGAVAVNELDPPRELLERPDLFLNYPLVRKLEELRHLDAVLADHGGDDQPDDGGAG